MILWLSDERDLSADGASRRHRPVRTARSIQAGDLERTAHVSPTPSAGRSSHLPCVTMAERGKGVRAAGRTPYTARALILLYLASLASSASAQTGNATPSLEIIIARMTQARVKNRARLRPYTVTRDYKLFGEERNKTKSEVTAAVTFLPPGLKQYAIQRHNGTRLGVKLIRRMLESEAEITKDYGTTDISPQNYDLRFIREEDRSGQRCYVLELLPKRKDRNLLRGNIWIDAETYLLLRSEGEPAKSPSWWLRDVRIAFVYGEVSGMWLQTASEVTADVRILGHHTIVSRDVTYKVSDLIARRVVPSEIVLPDALNGKAP